MKHMYKIFKVSMHSATLLWSGKCVFACVGLAWFDSNPVAIGLPAFIAVHSRCYLSRRWSCHWWFDHRILMGQGEKRKDISTLIYAQGNVKQCFVLIIWKNRELLQIQPLTLMLKEIIFLFGDIFGLDMSSGSTSLLCFKKTRKTCLVRCVYADGRVSFDRLSFHC